MKRKTETRGQSFQNDDILTSIRRHVPAGSISPSVSHRYDPSHYSTRLLSSSLSGLRSHNLVFSVAVNLIGMS